MPDGFVFPVPVGSGGGGLADGNYGDVTVSGGGTVIDINADAVGTPEIDDGTVTDAKLRDSAGLSVIGRATGIAGAPADIVSGGANQVLLTDAAGTTVGFGTVATGGITDGAVTFPKMVDIPTNTLIGRDTAGTGDPENIALNVTLEMDGANKLQRAALTGDVTASAGSNSTTIANDAVTDAKLRNSGACSVIGRSANSTGDPADISAGSDGVYLGRQAGVVSFHAIGVSEVSGLGDLATQNASALNTAMTLHRQDFGVRCHYGAHASAPTLAAADPTAVSATDPDQFWLGFSFADALVTWIRFGFTVPADVESNSDITPKLCFIINSANNRDVDIDVIGTIYQDGDVAFAGGGGTAFSVGTTVNINGYSASAYVIVDLTALGLTVNPGDFIQGVIQRDATAGNATDTYADFIGLTWIEFNGVRHVI